MTKRWLYAAGIVAMLLGLLVPVVHEGGAAAQEGSGLGVVLVAGSNPVIRADRAVQEILEDTGMPVTVLDDDNIAGFDFSTADLVVVTSTVKPEKVGSLLTDLPVPLINLEGFLNDDLLLATSGGEDPTLTQRVQIVDPANPVAAGHVGSTRITKTAQKMNFGVAPTGADVVATVVGNSNRAAVYLLDEGVGRSDGSPSPQCRGVGAWNFLGLRDISDEGIDILSSLVAWALTCSDTPTPVDIDGDGFSPPADCNDDNPAINPGATDIADNNIDEDCDGTDATEVPTLDGDIVFVASRKNPIGADQAILGFLQDTGRTVTVADDDDVANLDTDGVALLVISTSVVISKVGDLLAGGNVPVLMWEAYLFDEHGLGNKGNEAPATNRIQIVDPAHPLAAGLTGSVTVTTRTERLSRILGPAPGLQVVATVPNQPAQPVLGILPAGGITASGAPAAACTVMFFANIGGANRLTAAGAQLARAAVDVALDCGGGSVDCEAIAGSGGALPTECCFEVDPELLTPQCCIELEAAGETVPVVCCALVEPDAPESAFTECCPVLPLESAGAAGDGAVCCPAFPSELVLVCCPAVPDGADPASALNSVCCPGAVPPNGSAPADVICCTQIEVEGGAATDLLCCPGIFAGALDVAADGPAELTCCPPFNLGGGSSVGGLFCCPDVFAGFDGAPALDSTCCAEPNLVDGEGTAALDAGCTLPE